MRRPPSHISSWRDNSGPVIAAVDIGASKSACFIAQVNADDPSAPSAEVIGVGCHGGRLKTGANPSADEMETSLRRCVDAAERMAGVRVDRVVVGIPGRFVRARRIGVDLEIADGLVTQDDIDDCQREGASLAAAPGCAPLYAAPIGFRIDGEALLEDPVGYSGGVLSAEMLGLSVREGLIESYSGVVERCGLTATDFVPAPAAAAEACLLEDEKELGVVLIDIGALSTSYAVFDKGALIDCGGVAIGGAHVTRDVAQIFSAPLPDAERIKTLHGAALLGGGDEHRFIDFPQLGDKAETSRASRADLCEVIIPRMEEIMEIVCARLPRDEAGRLTLRRAVITGGGSLLVGAREIAEKALSMKARLGRPLGVVGAPEAGTAPGFSVCAGLLQHAVNNGSNAKFSLGAAGQSPHSLMRSTLLGGVESWIRAKF
ncbi:MAG: cell division protein FtsA [Pseudomonadota bacterium]